MYQLGWCKVCSGKLCRTRCKCSYPISRRNTYSTSHRCTSRDHRRSSCSNTSGNSQSSSARNNRLLCRCTCRSTCSGSSSTCHRYPRSWSDIRTCQRPGSNTSSSSSRNQPTQSWSSPAKPPPHNTPSTNDWTLEPSFSKRDLPSLAAL